MSKQMYMYEVIFDILELLFNNSTISVCRALCLAAKQKIQQPKTATFLPKGTKSSF